MQNPKICVHFQSRFAHAGGYRSAMLDLMQLDPDCQAATLNYSLNK